MNQPHWDKAEETHKGADEREPKVTGAKANRKEAQLGHARDDELGKEGEGVRVW